MNLRGTMMQSFHWYTSNDGQFWNNLAQRAINLNKAGFTGIWLPPAYKGWSGTNDVGYGVYDLFDCGEFQQKGTVRTKYGTKDEYHNCIEALQNENIQVYADVVLNHKMGADDKEYVNCVTVNPFNRTEHTGSHHDRNAWTKYSFPDRNNKYSSMEWNWWHFDAFKEYGKIFKLKGKHFDTHVDKENVNYDFLMGCDLDFDNEQVRGEVHYWGKWYLDTFGVDGFRIDAIKHIRSFFFKDWLDDMRNQSPDLFAVGEYWSYDLSRLQTYIDQTQGVMKLFDAPLHYNFHLASKEGARYDLGAILNNSLVKENPFCAVTIVENHDTQPLQSLESLVEAWFKPLAYAIILLRDEGYPCVFEADYYGAHYFGEKNNVKYEIWLASHKYLIDIFLKVRRTHTYGDRYDYFDHHDIIGWTFTGDQFNNNSMAVIMSNNKYGTKWMKTGRKSKFYHDITGHVNEKVKTNSDGWGNFPTLGGKVSVWIEVP
ncbi:alpha-amylase [Flammeovirga sp. SJP92]|uniref:alpha-amylase n=1 Tax=Flammeovirga sp. SJP92 TaxID=1775430 RepID=UPI0007884F84|nr:alpha-amylase [Flammeovirga sp. SJP92]KXX69805.1 alpha-amylase [Flammeovirga sp. SJP92]